MAELTPEEINEILDEYFSETFQRTYIGKRYVPIFGRKGESTMEWDNEAPYEPLTIVLYEGNSYTSRQYVPVGVEITNTDFWALTGNYNAQVEAYRQEVQTYTQAYGTAIDALEDALPIASFDGTNTIDSHIDSIEAFLPETVIGFDTVADMKASTILKNGMICHTNGFHSSDDGGAAYYKISDSGTANEMNVISCGSLLAIALIDSLVHPEIVGAYGDGETDDADYFEFLLENGYGINGYDGKKYLIESLVQINQKDIVIKNVNILTNQLNTFDFIDCDEINIENSSFKIDNENGYLQSSICFQITRFKNAVFVNNYFEGFHYCILQTCANTLAADYVSDNLHVNGLNTYKCRCAVHFGDLNNGFIENVYYNDYFATSLLAGVFYIRANVKICEFNNIHVNNCNGSIFHFNRIDNDNVYPPYDESDMRISKVIASNIYGNSIGRIADTNTYCDFKIENSNIYGTNDSNRAAFEVAHGCGNVNISNCIIENFDTIIYDNGIYEVTIPNSYQFRNYYVNGSNINCKYFIYSEKGANFNIINNIINHSNVSIMIKGTSKLQELHNLFYATITNMVVNQIYSNGAVALIVGNTQTSVDRLNNFVSLTSASTNNLVTLINNNTHADRLYVDNGTSNTIKAVANNAIN